MDTIIVTAPTSVLASQFVKYLRARYQIFTIGRRNSDLEYDFRGDNVLQIPVSAKCIVHFVGIMNTESDSDIINMMNVNVMGTQRLLMAAKEARINQIILISSINVLIDKSSPYFNYYSITKKHSEEIAEHYCRQNDIKLCIFRPSQVIGPDLSYAKTQKMFYLMLQKIMHNENIYVYGRHDPLRNYIYSENLFRAICYAIDMECVGTWDIIDGKNYRFSEIVELMKKIRKSDTEIIYLADKTDICDNGFTLNNNFFAKYDLEYYDMNNAISRIINEIGENL